MSGFPEHLPSARLVERRLMQQLSRVFELHSFAEIDTRAVEPLADLLRKGETSKEVYVIQRLQEEGAAYTNKTLALHFDLTVPLARYILEHQADLAFPFKRYQIQKVWRGERPQTGRFREFYQADIDIIGRDQLAFSHEVDVALVMAEALASCQIGPFTIAVNHRQVCENYYRSLGLDDVSTTLQWIDKLAKIGSTAVAEGLVAHGATPAQAKACLELAGLRAADHSIVDQVEQLAARHGLTSAQLSTALAQLGELVSQCAEQVPGVVVADLSIARGLDYYTGTVYETTLAAAPGLGSICSGGRYDNLVSAGRFRFPGVGLSVGVSRIVAHLGGQWTASRSVPAAVWVAVNDEASRGLSRQVAAVLRSRQIACDISPDAVKYGKQIQAAQRRGIPYVWFPG
ncbi:MAG: histidine--tRNA ligase, partial [Bifidobacteriaceae bacterium]|nr:histidine--tRNA ligase [Bifidobacteriaceae bacterium]